MEMSATMSSTANEIQELRQRLTSMGSGLMISEDSMHSIVDLTKSIINDNKKDTRDTTVFRDCYRFAAALISADYQNFLNEDCNLFTAHTSALTWEYDSLSISVSENESGQPYDIYQDPVNVNNIIQAQKVLENVHVCVTNLLNTYPDHTTLLLIQKKINNILNLSLELPLIVFINNVERLIHEIQQWEIVAARHVSLVQNIDELNKLLVNWRHQELTMWENSLNTDNWKLDRKVSQDFLKYYNLFIEELKMKQYENDFESINLILEPILNSLTNATVGNYEFRLNLMKLFIDVVSSMPEINEKFRIRLKNILLNHYDFYGLYLKNIQEHLLNEFKRIGKELKDFIKTKKWGKVPPKITDVLKCHKIVFKYKRQWDGIINKSCVEFLNLNPINALKNVNLIKFSPETDIDFSESEIFKWCKNMLEYCTDMWAAMESFQKETKEFEEKSLIESKSEDKEVLEKKWKSNVKNLQQRKRNCVTQFVKELREMGLIAHGSELPRKTVLMTHLPLGDVKIVQSPVSTIRCLGLRLQLDGSDKSEEFAKFNEFKDRLISICDHLLLIACTNSTKIINFENNFHSIQKSIKSLVSTCQSEIVFSLNPSDIEQRLHKINENNMEKINQWSLFINTLKSNNNQTRSYPSLIADELKPKLLSGLDNFDLLNSVISRVDKLEIPSNFIVTREHIECINNQKLIVESINEVVDILKDQFSPELLHINSSITNSLSEFNKRNQESIANIESSLIELSYNPTNTKDNLSCFIKDLEFCVNEKLKKFKCILLTSKFDLSFTKAIDHLNTLESSLDLQKIGELINNIKNSFHSINNNEANEYRIKINEVIVPVLKHLEIVENEFLNILLNYHLILISAIDALLTVTMKLTKEGFCAPNDSAWNGEDENSKPTEKMNDFEMAGMDSGVGSNDVSDQIESESQIEGNSKDQGNEDPENQSEIPDEDNGIEMSDDINGKLHDPEVDDPQNKDGENDDDKLNDLEDKIGEVGDAPETDVNKQNWDNEPKEEEEEEDTKNKDERKGGVSEENTVEMVAGNEEENSKENGNKNETTNDQEDQDNFSEKNDEECNDLESDENNSDLPEKINDEPDKGDLPEETNAIDDFWNEEAGLEDNVEPESTQIEDIDNSEIAQEEENIDELKPNEERIEEQVVNNDTEQSINIAGGNEAINDQEMTYEPELGEENAESGTTGSGGGNNNMTNTENAQGTIDKNEPQTENKDSSKKNQDALTKPSENRKLGDANQNFKRKADVLDIQEDNENKRPKTTDAFSHIEKDNNDETNDQVLDDATANQQQHIPEVNDGENDLEESNYGNDLDKNKDSDLRNVLEEDKNLDSKDINMVESKEKSDCVIAIKEKQQERFSWSQYESKTEYLSRELCEMLRIVLEPTKANKLGGAYRTGKRLNMKKVIPYIASGFRKDKIWLRRNKPSQREYQVIIGVDNSASMSNNVTHQLFFESLAIVLNGLTFLEVGQVGVCKFGIKAEVVLPLYQQFSSEIGDKLVSTFDFSDKGSKFAPIIEQAIQLFGENRHNISSSTPRDTSQLLLLLSDGGISEDVLDPTFISLIREAHNQGIFVVVILLDSKASILNQKIVINDEGDFLRYLDVFPLQNYTVLQDATKLPALLTDVLRQWFELSSSSDKGPSR